MGSDAKRSKEAGVVRQGSTLAGKSHAVRRQTSKGQTITGSKSAADAIVSVSKAKSVASILTKQKPPSTKLLQELRSILLKHDKNVLRMWRNT